jgi:hypothetical protein
MRYFLLIFCALLAPVVSQAESVQGKDVALGVGYLAKTDGTRVYERAEGDAVAATVKKDFPMVAFESRNSWLGVMASESISNGRAHVRYWNNGQTPKGGETTAWVDLRDVERFQFDCCGDSGHCSGITKPLLSTGGYTDCFTQAVKERTQTKSAAAGSGTAELETLKYQLEVEKLKLEIEKLKLEREHLKSGSH